MLTARNQPYNVATRGRETMHDRAAAKNKNKIKTSIARPHYGRLNDAIYRLPSTSFDGDGDGNRNSHDNDQKHKHEHICDRRDPEIMLSSRREGDPTRCVGHGRTIRDHAAQDGQGHSRSHSHNNHLAHMVVKWGHESRKSVTQAQCKTEPGCEPEYEPEYEYDSLFANFMMIPALGRSNNDQNRQDDDHNHNDNDNNVLSGLDVLLNKSDFHTRALTNEALSDDRNDDDDQDQDENREDREDRPTLDDSLERDIANLVGNEEPKEDTDDSDDQDDQDDESLTADEPSDFVPPVWHACRRHIQFAAEDILDGSDGDPHDIHLLLDMFRLSDDVQEEWAETPSVQDTQGPDEDDSQVRKLMLASLYASSTRSTSSISSNSSISTISDNSSICSQLDDDDDDDQSQLDNDDDDDNDQLDVARFMDSIASLLLDDNDGDDDDAASTTRSNHQSVVAFLKPQWWGVTDETELSEPVLGDDGQCKTDEDRLLVIPTFEVQSEEWQFGTALADAQAC